MYRAPLNLDVRRQEPAHWLVHNPVKDLYVMSNVSTLRLYLLRAMYLFIAVGLALFVWPAIIYPPQIVANSNTVVSALLGDTSASGVGVLLTPGRELRRPAADLEGIE